MVVCRTDFLDELATDAMVKPLGHVVLDEFPDQVAQMPLAEDDEVIKTLVPERSNDEVAGKRLEPGFELIEGAPQRARQPSLVPLSPSLEDSVVNRN